jgi:adenylosuccinate lyase
MLKNIYKTNGAIFSQRVMTKLIEKGLSREEAYDKIQKLALISYNEEKDFKQLVLDSEIKDILTEEEILDAFKLDFYFKNIDYIYEKCNIK